MSKSIEFDELKWIIERVLTRKVNKLLSPMMLMKLKLHLRRIVIKLKSRSRRAGLGASFTIVNPKWTARALEEAFGEKHAIATGMQNLSTTSQVSAPVQPLPSMKIVTPIEPMHTAKNIIGKRQSSQSRHVQAAPIS